eukprot:5707320-Amphidinium_carterae.3
MLSLHGVAYDKTYGAHMGMNTDEGLALLVILLLRVQKGIGMKNNLEQAALKLRGAEQTVCTNIAHTLPRRSYVHGIPMRLMGLALTFTPDGQHCLEVCPR